MKNFIMGLSFTSAKKYLTSIFILLSIFALQACSTLFKDANYSIYSAPASGNLASIMFDFEASTPNQEEKSNGKHINFSQRSANLMFRKAVKIYDDPVNCVDYQIALEPDFQNLTVEAGKLITVEYRAIANRSLNIVDGTFVWCPTKFSFVPEAGQKYVAKKSARLRAYGSTGTCMVRVFKEGSDTPIPIIARDNTPIAWTGLSPRCSNEDMEKPSFVEAAKSEFECMIERTRMPC